MRLSRLQRHWDEFGRRDPYWAILTDPAKKGNRWDIDEFFKTGEREIEDVLAWVASLGLTVGRSRALDFGCGVGRLTQALALHFDQVTGVDIAPSMIALANSHNRHRDRCRYLLNASADLRQIPDASIDFLYSRLVLQHMPPRAIKAYVVEFVRVLADGGAAVFNVPGDPLDAPVSGGFVKTHAPRSLVRLRRRLRRVLIGLWTFPTMEVHGVPSEELVSLIEDHGATIADVRPDQSHGDGGAGFLYCVTISGRGASE
jgi:SAM-dependent methyltransferase